MTVVTAVRLTSDILVSKREKPVESLADSTGPLAGDQVG
jgi:hypothetical protein